MARRHWMMTLGAMGACGLGIVGLCAAAVFDVPCVSTGLSHGMWVDECPAGSPRLSIEVGATNLLRGEEAVVTVEATALYVVRRDDVGDTRGAPLYRGLSTTVQLLDSDGVEVPGVSVGGWERRRKAARAEMTLPDVPDGDYTLRVTVDAGFDIQTAELDVPLYTPAIAFAQSDRGLYQPGQEVLLRGVLLERTGLKPIDDRPARWRVIGPDGELMVEDDRAGAFGVLDTSFPLDRFAANGTYRARLESGDATDEITFDVRPFKLPRMSSSVSADARWYGVGDTVRLTGRATYLSGAPVADAPVTVRLQRTDGEWPMPLSWEEPIEVVTDAQGRWEAVVGEVPADLLAVSTFRAAATVTEAAGESVTGSTNVVTSLDDIVVSALTELGDGLVADANNRVWLRVATPDGVPLPGATLSVSNPWDSQSAPRTAVADEDGVATIQIDPGPPVTVTQPAPPERVRPTASREPELTRAQIVGGGPISLDQRRVVDRAHDAITDCQALVVGQHTAQVAARVGPDGRVQRVLTGDDIADACVADAVRQLRFEPGSTRTLDLGWTLTEPRGPSVQIATHDGAIGASRVVDALMSEIARQVRRDCLADATGLTSGDLLTASWFVAENESSVRYDAIEPERAAAAPASVRSCIVQHLTQARRPSEASDDAMGTLTVRLTVPPSRSTRSGQPTYTTGYELMVAASAGDEPVGESRVVLSVGEVPPLRLRATPSIAAPGDEVTLTMIRGPGFTGSLPDEVVWYRGTVEVGRTKVHEDTRSTTFALPDDVRDFVHTEVRGVRGVVFVDDAEPLTVALTSDAATYRPGETATLTVSTRAGDTPVAAAVGLSGVDESLGQLSPLTQPDAMSRVTVRASSDQPAFDSFGAAALAMGRIRGENAAQAAMSTVSSIPMDAAGDRAVSASASATPDLVDAIFTAFYRGRSRLVDRVRAWEDEAPEGEVLKPEDVVRMWRDVLVAARSEGEPVEDGFGRDLDLARLPSDLLVDIDPRGLVRDATRLPEDVIDWERWVEREVR